MKKTFLEKRLEEKARAEAGTSKLVKHSSTHWERIWSDGAANRSVHFDPTKQIRIRPVE